MDRFRNVHESIRNGYGDDFQPTDLGFLPTNTAPGSAEKIEILRRRVELGQPLWHALDRFDLSGLSGVKPKTIGERRLAMREERATEVVADKERYRE